MADSDQVPLADLEVMSRWSLAVVAENADRAELIDALRADLEWLQGRPGQSVQDAGRVVTNGQPVRTDRRRAPDAPVDEQLPDDDVADEQVPDVDRAVDSGASWDSTDDDDLDRILSGRPRRRPVEDSGAPRARAARPHSSRAPEPRQPDPVDPEPASERERGDRLPCGAPRTGTARRRRPPRGPAARSTAGSSTAGRSRADSSSSSTAGSSTAGRSTAGCATAGSDSPGPEPSDSARPGRPAPPRDQPGDIPRRHRPPRGLTARGGEVELPARARRTSRRASAPPVEAVAGWADLDDEPAPAVDAGPDPRDPDGGTDDARLSHVEPAEPDEPVSWPDLDDDAAVHDGGRVDPGPTMGGLTRQAWQGATRVAPRRRGGAVRPGAVRPQDR